MKPSLIVYVALLILPSVNSCKLFIFFLWTKNYDVNYSEKSQEFFYEYCIIILKEVRFYKIIFVNLLKIC